MVSDCTQEGQSAMPLAGLFGGCQLRISEGLGAAPARLAPSGELKGPDLCARMPGRALPSYVPAGQGIGPVKYMGFR